MNSCRIVGQKRSEAPLWFIFVALLLIYFGVNSQLSDQSIQLSRIADGIEQLAQAQKKSTAWIDQVPDLGGPR